MALIDLPTEPGPLERKLFGGLVVLFCGLVGAFLGWQFGWQTAARVIWGTGLLIAAVYYLVPGWQTKIYRGWLLAFYPIGFVISHVVLAAIWYLLFTPIALLRRLVAGDPLARKGDPEQSTYWIDREGPVESSRYFRQY